MNAIELLKEAIEVLMRGQDDEQANLAQRIEDYLAAPRESAMGEKWGPSTIDKIRQRNADGDFTLDYWRATELFEGCGRRVPKAMLEELAIEILDLADLTWKSGGQEYVKKFLTTIITKYGVEVEG